MTKIIYQDKLVNKLKRGDKKALSALFDYYYPRLYSYSKSFLKIEDGIDDIIQEVFLKIWENRENILNPVTFNSYVYTITKNLLLNELRSRLNNQKLKDKIYKLSVGKEYLLSDELEFNELKDRLDSIIGDLPANQKQIYFFSRNEGMSHKEIAKKLKISTKTVEYHISRSISFIKSRLSDFEMVIFACVLYYFL